MSNIINYQSNVKKKLFDLLMFSLYADPRTIYREYVQNALDSINHAVKNGILKRAKDGVVNIDIDSQTKNITIRDNGAGIDSNNAFRRLLDISGSQKDGVSYAGQFGIGRLVGGGYCHKLIFKTSAKGENIASMVTFDIDHIWKMVKEDDQEYLATEVMDACTIKEQFEEDLDTHYFEVKLCSVKSDSASILLSENEVISYLNIVAPVSYTSEFNNGLIYHSLEEMPDFKPLQEQIEKVQVFVGNQKIEKQYGLSVKGTRDEIDRLEYFKIETEEYGLLAWGWFALTKFSIQIPKDDDLSGIRLRIHNIQIGDFDLLSGKPLWQEDRGNSYFYGELFIVHNKILPNAARDGLAPTPEKEALYTELQKYFKELHGVYTKANVAKKAIEKIVEGTETIKSTRNLNDRIAIDKIDNKGIGVFNKLVRNARFIPLKHMLDLYKKSFETAKQSSEIARREEKLITKSNNDINLNSSNSNQSVSNIDDHTKTVNVFSDAKNKSVLGNFDDLGDGDLGPNVQSVYNENQNTRKNVVGETYKSEMYVKNEIPKERVNLLNMKLLSQLENMLNGDEMITLRRVFRILNTYCPQNEHDQHLIETLEREIVRNFKDE